jgi:hypothetical protein
MKFNSLIPLIFSYARANTDNEMHILFSVESKRSVLSENNDPLRDAYFAQDDMVAIADGGASNWTIEGIDTRRYANALIEQIYLKYNSDKR